MMNMRWIYLGIGWIAVALGGLGVALPVLPTTPFLLLALACFARSSPRSRAWLLNSPVLGPVLNDYLQHRVVPARAKAVALLLLWPTLGWAAAVQADRVPALSAGLLLLAAGVSLYLLRLPSRKASAGSAPD